MHTRVAADQVACTERGSWPLLAPRSRVLHTHQNPRPPWGCRRAGDRSGSTNRHLPRRSQTLCLRRRCRRWARMDRMANGEHLGQCPTCGGHRWWDNRSRKATGEMSRSQPDYVCTDCRHGRWNDGRQQAGRPTTRRTPAATVTVVPAVRQPSGVGQRVRTCAALKRDGTPCRNGAMAGSPFCGPHSTGGGVRPSRRPISAAARPRPASRAGPVLCEGPSTARNTGPCDSGVR